MKKFLLIIVSLLIPLCFCGCTEKADYSPYYNLSTFKGLEVYCWEIDDGEWKCGLTSGTNRYKSVEEIAFLQNEYPCPLKEMKKILQTYPEQVRKDTVVIVVDYPQTGDFYNYYKPSEIPDTYNFLYTALGLIQ